MSRVVEIPAVSPIFSIGIAALSLLICEGVKLTCDQGKLCAEETRKFLYEGKRIGSQNMSDISSGIVESKEAISELFKATIDGIDCNINRIGNQIVFIPEGQQDCLEEVSVEFHENLQLKLDEIQKEVTSIIEGTDACYASIREELSELSNHETELKQDLEEANRKIQALEDSRGLDLESIDLGSKDVDFETELKKMVSDRDSLLSETKDIRLKIENRILDRKELERRRGDASKLRRSNDARRDKHIIHTIEHFEETFGITSTSSKGHLSIVKND